MAKKMITKTINCATDIELSYDENSTDFKESFQSYKKHIRNDDIDGFLSHICHNILHFGWETSVDGVGYVKPKFKKWSEIPEPRSGVELVSDHFPSFDFEITY